MHAQAGRKPGNFVAQALCVQRIGSDDGERLLARELCERQCVGRAMQAWQIDAAAGGRNGAGVDRLQAKRERLGHGRGGV